MVVLEIKKRLFKKDAEKHFDFAFDTDREYRELDISFAFTPSVLEDRDAAIKLVEAGLLKYTGEISTDKVENYLPVKNLLTISIDSPSGPIGTAHRHMERQKHIITAEKASRGFLPAAVATGKWNMTVSTHAIVSEYVDITLTAEVKE